MLALDLFCGAGGASVGLKEAGFQVIGIDHATQKNYPYEFYVDCALSTLKGLLIRDFYRFACRLVVTLGEVDLIWASPPCQGFTGMNNDKSKHIDLISPTRGFLQALQRKKPSLKWVIENVEGSPLVNPLMLCGTMFKLGVEHDGVWFDLERHRLFETNFAVDSMDCLHSKGPTIGVYGGHVRCRSADFWREGGRDFPGADKKRLASDALGISHNCTMNELSEAIPPAYSCFIGNAAMKEIERGRTG